MSFVTWKMNMIVYLRRETARDGVLRRETARQNRKLAEEILDTPKCSVPVHG